MLKAVAAEQLNMLNTQKLLEIVVTVNTLQSPNLGQMTASVLNEAITEWKTSGMVTINKYTKWQILI